MPYIFLNTIADQTNFYVPTPIILSGDYVNGQNSIKTKCTNIISDETGGSAYLLTVPLAELLEILEREGFRTVKVNRNGQHNIWILHKNRNGDRSRRINNIKKHTVQIQKENYIIEENSSNSSIEKYDRYPSSRLYKPQMKSERCQTQADKGFMACGDQVNVFSVQCQTSAIITEPVEIPVKLQCDFQIQKDFEDVKEGTDFGCQCSPDETVPEKMVSEVKNSEMQTTNSDNTFLSRENRVFISEFNVSECGSRSGRGEIRTEKRKEEFVNVTSGTTIKMLSDHKMASSSKNSMTEFKARSSFDKADSFFKFGSDTLDESLQKNSKENFSRAQDILNKLEQRFKHEHDYFASVGIKTSKKKSTKKLKDKSKKLDNNSRASLNIDKNSVAEPKRDSKNELNKAPPAAIKVEEVKVKKEKKHPPNGEHSKDVRNEKRNPAEKTSKPKKKKSVESVAFYEAIDTSSVMSLHDNAKNAARKGANKKAELKKNQEQCKKELMNKYKNTNVLDNVRYVDCLENAGKIDCSKSRFRIDNSQKNEAIDMRQFDIQLNSSNDQLTPTRKEEIFKKKMQLLSNKPPCDFKERMSQRAEKPQTNRTRVKESSVRMPTNNRGKSQPSTSTAEQDRSSNLLRDLKTNKYKRGSTATYKIPPSTTAPSKKSKYQRINFKP